MNICRYLVTFVAIYLLIPALAAAKPPVQDPIQDSTKQTTSLKALTSLERLFDIRQKLFWLSPFEPVLSVEKPLVINPKLKGWDYTAKKLIELGVDTNYAHQILTDKKMPANKPIYFSLHPKESRNLYRGHNTAQTRRNALRFYKKNFYFFLRASHEFKVPDSVLLALLQVETRCGGYTGRQRVFPGLVRLANAASAENIKRNFKRISKSDKTVTIEQVRARAKWLEDTFLPHAVALLDLAKQDGLHPLEIRGSGSGAFGIPQFLPKNYFTYALDGDNDGKVDLFNAADAIFSVANYLSMHGWTIKALPVQNQQAVIWHYNHSKPYIETVLSLAQSLEPSITDFKSSVTDEFISDFTAHIIPASIEH